MRLKTITKLLIDAHKKDLEEKLWQKWLVDYGRMDETNFISFEKYKDGAFRVVDTKVDKEEILKKAEIIKNAHQKVKITE